MRKKIRGIGMRRGRIAERIGRGRGSRRGRGRDERKKTRGRRLFNFSHIFIFWPKALLILEFQEF